MYLEEVGHDGRPGCVKSIKNVLVQSGADIIAPCEFYMELQK